MMKIGTSFGLLRLATMPAWGQATQENAMMGGRFMGRVTYPNGAPVQYVRVQIYSDVVSYRTEGSTDVQGKFAFTGLPRSSMHLLIELVGYQPVERYADLSTTGMTNEDIVL